MSARRWRRRSGRLMAALCLTMAVTSGCRGIGGNVETIRYGREITPEGDRIRVAALQPRCGCVSLANATPEPVWLESWFYAIPIGSTVLEPGERRRVLFDWAGPESSDFYEMVAFKVGQDALGRPQRDDSQDGGLLIRDALPEYAQLTFMNCNDTSCEFGTLNMNRVFTVTGAQEDDRSRQRGVNVGSVIEVSAPINRCGCMLTRNTGSAAVTLRASLHGADTGRLTVPAGATVPIPFDWAGALEGDRYVIEIADVGRTGATGLGLLAPGASTTAPGRQGTPGAASGLPVPDVTIAPSMTIRLRDYIAVVGQLVDMDCTPDGPQFATTPAAQQPAQAATAAPVNAAGLLQCPWMPGGNPGLAMFAVYDRARTIVRPPAPPTPPLAEPAAAP